MYNLFLRDGSTILSEGLDWKTVSEQQSVIYLDGKKTVFLCTLDVVKISLSNGELQTEIDIPDGCKVYRAFRGMATLNNGTNTQETFGQCAGIVKDGEVIEERVTNVPENIIQGFRK